MGDLPPKNPNLPKLPTKPPDISSTMVGHHSPVMPNPNTSPTPPHIGLTPSNSLPIAVTLGFALSEAAAPTNGGMIISHSPFDAPPIDEQVEGSIAQNLEPLISGQPRMPMPSPSGPLVAGSGPPFSDAPNPASPSSSHLIVPRMAHALPPAADSRTAMPATKAHTAMSIQTSKQGVPNSDGLPLNQISEPSKSLDPIAEDSSDANVPAPALPARTARAPAGCPACHSG
ncbi:hypothetical protein Adt_20506 [Abeliophyllum distichum]|uniref:Uncharacterized protein n=1 Tax=Abeliophyllum distichum TaxID=126358 RepID=A0ABD1SWQ6_9LAMI